MKRHKFYTQKEDPGILPVTININYIVQGSKKLPLFLGMIFETSLIAVAGQTAVLGAAFAFKTFLLASLALFQEVLSVRFAEQFVGYDPGRNGSSEAEDS